MSSVAQQMGRSSAQVALAWTLLRPEITSTILGVRTFEQLEDNLAALGLQFSVEQLAELDAASRVELGFPHDLIDSPVAHGMFGGVTVEKQRHR